MQTSRLRLVLSLLLAGIATSPAAAQTVLTTLAVPSPPGPVAVNTTTNRVYVGNEFVTVIDGATNNIIANISAGGPTALAVNEHTNKIYSAWCDYYVGSCYGYVAVIDGATNTLVTQVPVGLNPVAIAVNPSTNKIYVANNGDDTVTAIDGVSNQPTTIPVCEWSGGGICFPFSIAINSVTNKIYVVDQDGTNGFYDMAGQVMVIDGSTNMTTAMVTVGYDPVSIALNATTNKIYVVNSAAATVSVIDGATEEETDVDLGTIPSSGVGVNSATNKIYVVNECRDFDHCNTGSVSIIDGSTNNVTTINDTPSYQAFECNGLVGTYQCPTVAVDSQRNKIYIAGVYPNVLTAIDGASNAVQMVGTGDYPLGLALNAATNRIYVANSSDATVSVINPSAKLQFVPLTPCRVVDTRNPDGTFGGPAIQGGDSPRAFPLPQGSCHIPSNAIAYSLNATVVPHGTLGYLTILPSSQLVPNTSTLNSGDGRIKANALIIQAGLDAGVSAYASDTTDLLLDVNGYFIPAGSSTLAFFPLTPCRVADTRNSNEPSGLGPPSLRGGVARSFPIRNATSCNIPSTARAYSLNLTAVPPHSLGYLTVWPTGQSQPVVSTLNDPTGTVVANAAIVPAGTSGAVSVYASDNTNLVIDINGYFAAPNSGSNPLSLYTLQSCRALDTRSGRGGEFSGELVIDVLENQGYCPMSSQAQAFDLNATVVPIVPLQYLTLWPDGLQQPVVSTLNAPDGTVTSNMAIVPTSIGLIDAYTTNLTHLLLDVSGYFAP